MPLLCVGEKISPTQTDEDSDVDEQGEITSFWQEAPDSILLHIFGFLGVKDLSLVTQTCKTWNRVSYDESLWKNLMRFYLNVAECTLPPGKPSWRSEVRRYVNHRPVVLTETLQYHTDEVLHVSFSHNGELFSTTSKDATLKIWTLGKPTTLKYTKDFRELLSWDFTQYSCFNESDTMVLVSSVKTTGYMDRRGYMAVLSLIHDFQILRIVTMDPSQLFGAWLDDSTFLGGSLEISLDRFATTVQIEAYDVPEIFSPLPRPPLPYVEESSGRTLFTFSSETASLIKFLTVAVIPSPVNSEHKEELEEPSLVNSEDNVDLEEEQLADLSSNVHNFFSDLPSGSETIVSKVNVAVETGDKDKLGQACDMLNKSDEVASGSRRLWSSDRSNSGYEQMDLCSDSKDIPDCKSRDHVAAFQQKPSNCSLKQAAVTRFLLKNDDVPNVEDPDSSNNMELENLESECTDKEFQDHNSTQQKLNRPANLECCGKSTKPSCFSKKTFSSDNEALTSADQALPSTSYNDSMNFNTEDLMRKNLIFVTGEFAVALHQLGFKNVPPYAKESVLSRGITPMDEDNPESFMVVNYSNNDIHFVNRQQETDKPDNLLDLYGHVTGLCLTADQRYLFINCRPWIGNVDRTDPWATPDLSPNIEVRVIDLVTLKDLGVRYIGHKGFSPSNMCCFVFLDVSEDYVASGSEDSQGYLWDKHYGALIAKYGHESGVVNAVGFNPRNQEVLVTVSDDSTIKVWRSKHEARKFYDKSE